MIRYMPRWLTGGSAATPRLENGTLLGAHGTDWAAVLLRPGSVTTYGSGQWLFEMPRGVNVRWGSAVALGTEALEAWTSIVTVDDGWARLYMSGSHEPIGPTCPFAWQAGALLRMMVGPVPQVEEFTWGKLTAHRWRGLFE